jgi:hypothetical protein
MRELIPMIKRTWIVRSQLLIIAISELTPNKHNRVMEIETETLSLTKITITFNK